MTNKIKKIFYLLIVCWLLVLTPKLVHGDVKSSKIFTTSYTETKEGSILHVQMEKDSSITDGKLYISFDQNQLTYQKTEKKEGFLNIPKENFMVNEKKEAGKIVLAFLSEEPLKTGGTVFDVYFSHKPEVDISSAVTITTDRIYNDAGELKEENATVTSIKGSSANTTTAEKVTKEDTTKGSQEDAGKTGEDKDYDPNSDTVEKQQEQESIQQDDGTKQTKPAENDTQKDNSTQTDSTEEGAKQEITTQKDTNQENTNQENTIQEDTIQETTTKDDSVVVQANPKSNNGNVNRVLLGVLLLFGGMHLYAYLRKRKMKR